VIDHPPIVGVERQNVLVREGRYICPPWRRGVFDRW